MRELSTLSRKTSGKSILENVDGFKSDIRAILEGHERPSSHRIENHILVALVTILKLKKLI
jgi:hypothetical protein